ncbi:MAG TPA: hypothetical protein VJC16_05895 [Candidatus Nanoarchaeia archaeon]|nr:hypothetical protein [Candidatus Nanoarchaeia archaeon]
MPYANLIATADEDYLLQIRQVNKPQFSPGQYPYLFPGNCSFFGGEINPGETASESFTREMREELPGLIFPSMNHRVYHWKEDIPRVMDRANAVFNGNLEHLLGFALDQPFPDSGAGKKYRGQGLTYREWLHVMSDAAGDNYFVARIDPAALLGVQDQEGGGHIWVPYFVAQCLVMSPSDKLAFLDDISGRVEQGEIALI